MKIYIAGPMSGIPEWNFPAFARAAAALREAGYTVVSPHEMHKSSDDQSTQQPWAELMKSALRAMLTCDSIYLLHGWTNSKGARIEWRLAQDLGFNILYQPQGESLVH